MNLIDIKSPVDLKGLSLAELTDLTAQARQALMTKVSEHGGWGQRVASFYGPSNVRVKNYGIAKEFHDRYDATELLRENGVSLEQIVADAKQILSV